MSLSSSIIMRRHSSSEEERKRKRMQSNRESARRSRMRKQKYLDDLAAQASSIRKINEEIIDCIEVTTQSYVKVESENCVLRAQMTELSSRLQSLRQISSVFTSVVNDQSYGGVGVYGLFDEVDHQVAITQQQQLLLSNDSCFFNHPIMASSSTMFS